MIQTIDAKSKRKQLTPWDLVPAEQHAKKISGPGKSRSASDRTRKEENSALRQVDIELSVLKELQQGAQLVGGRRDVRHEPIGILVSLWPMVKLTNSCCLGVQPPGVVEEYRLGFF